MWKASLPSGGGHGPSLVLLLLHVAELRRKLEDNPSQPRYILTVWKSGYRLQR